MDIDERIKLITSIGEEIIGGDNMIKLLTNKKEVFAYDGFEPSGRMHIAQGLLRAHNVNKFVKAGVKFKFWVADWFALMNLKLGGDIKKIQKAGHLMIETWKACGMILDAVDDSGKPMVEFIWSSDEINKRSDEYWKLVLDIGTRFNLTRVKRCTQIMGRKDDDLQHQQLTNLQTEINQMKLDFMKIKDNNNININIDINNKFSQINQIISSMLETNKEDLAASQIFYPVMQCADIFFLKVDFCSLGQDQKKVNMLAIEYCDKIKRKNKPIIVSHHMIMGLDGSDKMSKSNPDNTIFLDDSESDVKRKITKAFCEPGNIVKNPLLDWTKWIILPITQTIQIPIKSQENKVYVDYQELENDYKNQLIHPSELKKGLISIINQLLVPIRKHFVDNKEANELLSQVKSYTNK